MFCLSGIQNHIPFKITDSTDGIALLNITLLISQPNLHLGKTVGGIYFPSSESQVHKPRVWVIFCESVSMRNPA